MSRFKTTCLLIFEMMKSGHQPLKHACCVNKKQDMKVMKKKFPDNENFCNKNVNVVEKNYIKAQKYLTMKRTLAFYWLIVFVTMMTPIFLHVKDKNDMFTARGEDMIF